MQISETWIEMPATDHLGLPDVQWHVNEVPVKSLSGVAFEISLW